MKNNNSFSEIKEVLDRAEHILIISHILPDGDNIASVLGMAISLGGAGKKVTPVVNGALPEYYRFLPQVDMLIPPEQASRGRYDVVLALDMSDKERGGEKLAFAYNDSTVVNIDHHISNDYFGDYNYVEPQAAATTQILTKFLLETEYGLNRDIATAFYTGLLTDSGNFTYQSTSSETLSLGAELLKYKPDLEAIRMNVYENISFRRKKILGQALNNAVKIEERSIAYSTLNFHECRALAAQGQDFEGVIDNLIGVNGIKLAVFFRELQEGLVKVGFRGRLGVDVTEVAKIYGGGGHKAAGGCSVEGDFENVVNDVIGQCCRYMESTK
ncbi:MAG: DHH family phosphoesterase [Bacillota bacterium]|nr:DHH family phosphoesterase [Bacillota bacterium]